MVAVAISSHLYVQATRLLRTTLRICKEAAKLQAKRRHVDIHNHWMRQEYASGRIQIKWKETTHMVASGMTKALARAKFSNFVSQLGLEDIRERLSTVKKMEELGSKLSQPKREGRSWKLKIVAGAIEKK